MHIANGVRMSVNYGLNRVRFPSPVPAGSRIRARFTLQSLNNIADGVEATFSVVIDRENSEKPCCSGVGDPLLCLIRSLVNVDPHSDQSELCSTDRRAAPSATLTTSGREAKRASLVNP